MKQSSIPTEFQREKIKTKCQCPFVIKLRLNQASSFYEVYQMNDQHNHDLFTELELAQMSQNRFIPDEVKIKMLELNELWCAQLFPNKDISRARAFHKCACYVDTTRRPEFITIIFQ